MTILVACGLFAAFLVMPHVRGRILSFLEAPSWSSHIGLAQITLGSGGPVGLGVGAGIMKLGHLPECGNDFVFSIVGEELGFAGTMTVLLFLAIFGYYGFKVAAGAGSAFPRLLAFGAVFIVVFQALAHVAVNTAMAPAKGIDFPLLGSGGSSLCFALGSVGLLRSVGRATGSSNNSGGKINPPRLLRRAIRKRGCQGISSRQTGHRGYQQRCELE
jgi:cell division protein FtsW